MNYGVTNGEGTIEYKGFGSVARAHAAAQKRANDHGEHFWVFRETGPFPRIVEAVAPEGYTGPTPRFEE